jgi:toxin ParE1/3/4
MNVFWLESAIADVEEIVAYIEANNPAAARQVASGLYDAAARLVSHPRIGRRGRSRGTRELVVPSLPFIIAYRIRADRVEVIRVIHGRRDWHKAFKERS